MGTESMRGHLLACRLAYAKAGPLVRSQVAPFMGPMLELLEQLVFTAEQQRRGEVMEEMATDGLKAQSCRAGACATCADRGSNSQKSEFYRVIPAGARVSTLSAGLEAGSDACDTRSAFPPIEG